MQGCQMSIATKVLVMDLYAVQYAIPARKPKTQNKPQQKQEKHTTKPKTKEKRQRELGSQPAMEITCMMTTYVSIRDGPEQETKQNKHKTHQRATKVGARSNKAPCGNQGSPQPGSPRSQRAAVRHDITPSHFEANTDNAGSQREW